MGTLFYAFGSLRVWVTLHNACKLFAGRGWHCLHHLAASAAPSDSKVAALQLLEAAGADAEAMVSTTQQTPLHVAALHRCAADSAQGCTSGGRHVGMLSQAPRAVGMQALQVCALSLKLGGC